MKRNETDKSVSQTLLNTFTTLFKTLMSVFMTAPDLVQPQHVNSLIALNQMLAYSQ